MDETNIKLFGFFKTTGGKRSLYDFLDSIDFIVSFTIQAVLVSLMVRVKMQTVVHDVPLHSAPLSADGLAALATHTPAFLFPENVARFGPLLDASAMRLSMASERMAAVNRLTGL